MNVPPTPHVHMYSTYICTVHTNLITTSYSLSFPLDSLHLRYLTEASTLAAEKVLGSFSNEITLNRIVLHGKISEGGDGVMWKEAATEWN